MLDSNLEICHMIIYIHVNMPRPIKHLNDTYLDKSKSSIQFAQILKGMGFVHPMFLQMFSNFDNPLDCHMCWLIRNP
jgi:hypothetical protein